MDARDRLAIRHDAPSGGAERLMRALARLGLSPDAYRVAAALALRLDADAARNDAERRAA